MPFLLLTMTLQEFSRDVVPLIQALLTLCGLISVLLLFWQIRQAGIWNRLQSTYNFLNVDLTKKLEIDMLATTKALGIDIYGGLDAVVLDKLDNNTDALIATKAVINDCENLCAAYQIGYIDRDCAYSVHSARITYVYDRFKPLIYRMRDRYKDDEIWLELEKTALEWKAKQNLLESRHKAKLARLEVKLLKTKGAPHKA